MNVTTVVFIQYYTQIFISTQRKRRMLFIDLIKSMWNLKIDSNISSSTLSLFQVTPRVTDL